MRTCHETAEMRLRKEGGVNTHQAVSGEQWTAANRALLAKEKSWMR
jgi:hypothetical protein